MPIATQSHVTVRQPNATNNVTSDSARPTDVTSKGGGGFMSHCSTIVLAKD